VEMGVTYPELINLSYDGNGTVTALQTDMVKINLLLSEITQESINALKKLCEQKILIPLGTLIGGPWLSGRGPDVQLRIIPASLIDTSIRGKLTEAGINQTHHELIFTLKLTVKAMIPGYNSETQVTSDVILTDTVIVGTVPSAYTRVYDGTDPLAGILQDYGA